MSGDVADGPDLGAWAGSDLGITARANIGCGADSGSSPPIRFLRGVVRVLRRCLVEQDVESRKARLAIFLLVPVPDEQVLGTKPQRVPMLNNGLTPVTGRLWFVNASAVAGKYIELQDQGDDDLFNVVTRTLGLGSVPAVVFDPRTTTPTARFYPDGLSAVENCEAYPLREVSVSIARIFDAIEQIHMKYLITPGAQGSATKLWTNGSKCWPGKRAEAGVQVCLHLGLITAFPSCTVRVEQHQVSGRLDLEVEENDESNPGSCIRHAVLELKVLKSFSCNGAPVSASKNKVAVMDGVQQAAAYREERRALAAALCCFDMRTKNTEDACFSHVREMATELQVQLRTWFLFGTAEKYRKFRTEACLG